MGLKEVKKELEEQIEKAVELEKEQEKTALESLSKATDGVVKEDEVKEEPKKEEEKVEEKPKEEEPKKEEEKTATGYAKERQARKDRLAADLAAANARIAVLEDSLKKPTTKVVEEKSIPEPDPQTNPTGWMAWKIQQQEEKIEKLSGWKAEQDTVKAKENLRERATRDVEGYEKQLRAQAPDYDDVKNWYGSMLATSIKIVNPKLPQKQVIELVNNRLLTRAAELLAEGYENPVEAMYLEAKQLGYQPIKQQSLEKEEPKPDMDKVAKIRSRNAGMAGASGSGGEADVTAKTAIGMTNAEFARLKPEQKKRLFASLR